MAMFPIGGTKALGPDQSNAVRTWSLYATEIFSIMKNVFASGVIPAGLNFKPHSHTLITRSCS